MTKPLRTPADVDALPPLELRQWFECWSGTDFTNADAARAFLKRVLTK